MDWIEKTVVLPLSEIALTVRVHPPEGGMDAVVWDALLPAGADTDFIEHYLCRRHGELKQNYPQFACPDLGRFGTTAWGRRLLLRGTAA